MAVPRGCGQLGSGVGAAWARPHVSRAAPCARLGHHPFIRWPHAVGRIKRLAFSDHRPGQVQQLVGGGTAGHFRRLARRAQALVVGFDDRIKAGRAQRRQIECRLQPPVLAMPDLGAAPDTAARLVGQRHQARIGAGQCCRGAGLRVHGSHQQPDGRDLAEASGTGQQRGRLRLRAVGQHLWNFGLQAGQALVQIGNHAII